MSNSIWKTPEETPKDFCDVVLANFRTGSCCVFLSPFHNRSFDYDKWCYLTDLIAQADKAERLQKQLDSLKKHSDSLRNRINKMLKKNKTLKNTAADYFMKSVELGIELEKMKSNN